MDDSRQVPPLSEDIAGGLWEQARALREPAVEFARRLIQTPSLPGSEQDVAALVSAEMQTLGYDEVSVDEAGNVIGHIRATSSPAGTKRRSVMFNTHMDHVDVGDVSRWPFPPYSATVHEDFIWGRGASDLKGSLACQIYMGALLKQAGVPLPNDVYVAGVVQEEIGGLGSATLARHLQTDYAVIGEPSDNALALGHRGRTEVLITVEGKSVHASVPGLGINPLYSVARALSRIEQFSFNPDPRHPGLGPTTVAPTLISTDQTSPNVVPGVARLVLDFRNSPVDTPGQLLSLVQEVLNASLSEGATGTATIEPHHETSYTGLQLSYSRASPAFGVAPDSPLVSDALSALNTSLRRDVATKIWPFATDAGHLVSAGIQCIGFGPGREDVIHTVNERISIEQMVEAIVGNAALAIGLR